MNRRDIIKSSGALLALSLPISRALGVPDTPVVLEEDLLLHSGKFITLDDRKPQAEAVLVRAGRIVMVGSNDEVRKAGGATRQLDLQGKTVIPGFVDNHSHIEWSCMAGDHIPFVGREGSIALIIERIRRLAAQTPKGQWVVVSAFGFPDNVAEKRWPTREDLDAATTDHPVMILLGIHASIMNTTAFKQSGYWDAGNDDKVRWVDGSPRRGTYVHRDSAGHPTGVATEVWDLIGNRYSAEDYMQSIRKHFPDWFLAKGLTSITTLPNVAPEQQIALERLSASGELSARVRFYPTVPHAISLDDIVKVGWRSGFGNDRLVFGGVKLFIDNGTDGMGNTRADLKWAKDHLVETLTACQRGGLQVIMHAVTPDGVTMAMDAVEAAQKAFPNEISHRMDHLTPTDLKLIRRAKALNLTLGITAPQTRPGTTTRFDYQRRHRYRTLLNEGVKTILVLDAAGPGGDYHPMRGIANVISDEGHGGFTPPGESLTLDEALKMWTLWAAASNGDASSRGSIEPGKFGDFAVLSDDPRGKTSAEVFEITTPMTIMGGRIVHGN